MIECLEGIGPGARAWDVAWERTGRQPFAHRRFVELLAQPGDRAACVVWHDPAGGVALLPLIHRRLPATLAEADAHGGPTWTDAVSPYGFGGPFWAGEVNWSSFFSALLEWMREERIITCFLRASLSFPSTVLRGPVGLEVRHISDNVIVDLTRSDETQWQHYEHKVRKNVKKAQRANLRVEIQTDFRNLDQFLVIYYDTMRRRSADPWYFFRGPLLEKLGEDLHGSYVVAEVYDAQGEMVSAELVLESDRELYSFLGGTLGSAYAYAPNDLLKHAVIAYGRGRGKAAYVLGGGFEPGDGIFRYKRSFDVDGVQPFFGIQLTAEHEAYASLIQAAGVRGQDGAVGPAVRSGYFPAYRAP
jgi:hypothetical protein